MRLEMSVGDRRKRWEEAVIFRKALTGRRNELGLRQRVGEVKPAHHCWTGEGFMEFSSPFLFCFLRVYNPFSSPHPSNKRKTSGNSPQSGCLEPSWPFLEEEEPLHKASWSTGSWVRQHRGHPTRAAALCLLRHLQNC